MVGRRRRAALDCRPPLWGHGKPEKIPKQQSTCGRRRAGAIWDLQGVMKVTPYARIRNLVARRRRAAKTCRLPLFWVNERQKNLNNNQPVGRDVWGVRETAGGHGSDPARPPSHVGQAAPPGGLRRLKHPPGSKTNKRGLSQQSTGGGGCVGAAGGRAGM